MFFEITIVILPVFLLVSLGFIACSIDLLPKSLVDNLAKLCQDFGIPFLLFFNLAILDLDNAFDFQILICFYISMVISFLIISCISYFVFEQPYINSIILGFCAMFSNGVLLGLPISERAFGSGTRGGASAASVLTHLCVSALRSVSLPLPKPTAGCATCDEAAPLGHLPQLPVSLARRKGVAS